MAVRMLSKYRDRLRLPDESDEQLFERLRASNRGAPQKPGETEADFFRRLVWNAFQRVYMTTSEAGRNTLARRRETLKSLRGTSDPRAINEKARETRRAVNRRAILVALKSKPCMDCGGSFPSCVMQFDHRDPATKDRRFTSPSNMVRNGSEKRFRQEIAKCDLVCANCHAIRTHITRPGRAT